MQGLDLTSVDCIIFTIGSIKILLFCMGLEVFMAVTIKNVLSCTWHRVLC